MNAASRLRHSGLIYRRFIAVTAALGTSLGVSSASADVTYPTLTGTVNLVAGLTNLSSVTAITSTNQSVGIGYITDTSWSTGIANLGQNDANGILAGTFGGGTYFASSNKVFLIGTGGTSSAWGGWTVRLQLSSGTYGPSASYTNADLVPNPTVLTATNSEFFLNPTGASASLSAVQTYYQELNIAAFDPTNIGITGIELSGFQSGYPDISFIGVTGAAVPEPATCAMALAGLACGGYSIFRRRKRA